MKKILIVTLTVLSMMLALASCEGLSDLNLGAIQPVITVDDDGYVVVNGVKTEHKVDNGENENTCAHRDVDDNSLCDKCGEGYTDGKDKETADEISVDEDGYVVVNGVKTEHRVDKEDKITVNPDGYVVVNGVVTEYMTTVCQHIFDTETVGATCNEGGYDVKTCKFCKVKKVCNKTDPLGHDFAKVYSTDEAYHWYACSRCKETLSRERHNEDEDGCCASCGIPLSSTPGIIYDISADGTYAEVLGYTGAATKVKIADEYEGLPVKIIYSEAFKDNDYITAVVIPDSVTGIGNNAFRDCTSLTSVTIGNGVTSIGEWAFSWCSSLTSVTIGNGVTSIGSHAFQNCSSLTSVVIPDSVTSISSYAFSGCTSLTDVYYSGSKEEWEIIVGNDAFASRITIHFDYVKE